MPVSSPQDVRRRAVGFTLVELLVVMAVIILLVGLIVPALASRLGGYKLDAASQQIVAQLNLARQTALSTNKPVQVCFYKITSASSGPTTVWRAMQCFLQTNNVVTPLGKATYFPEPVIMVDNSALIGGTDPSTLLDPRYFGINNVSAGDAAHALPPPYGMSAYTYFLYRPDGHIDQAVPAPAPVPPQTVAWSDGWITLKLSTAPLQANGLPANYVTVQVHAVTGTIRALRP